MKKFHKRKHWFKATLDNLKVGSKIRIPHPPESWTTLQPIPILPNDTGKVISIDQTGIRTIVVTNLDKDTENSCPNSWRWLMSRLEVLK